MPITPPPKGTVTKKSPHLLPPCASIREKEAYGQEFHLLPISLLWQGWLRKGQRVKLVLCGGSLAWGWALIPSWAEPWAGAWTQPGRVPTSNWIQRAVRPESHWPSALLTRLSQAGGRRGSSHSLEGWGGMWYPVGCGLYPSVAEWEAGLKWLLFELWRPWVSELPSWACGKGGLWLLKKERGAWF